MVYKCENCGRALEYNPELRLMECKSCGRLFAVEQVSVEEQEKEEIYSENRDVVKSPEEESTNEYPVSETMECNVYSCSSCGAELSVNGVEAATFCPYCGQPSIVFDRISKQMKPRYIIPFRFKKEQVIDAIRERFSKGFFIPKQIREFEVERIRGIYIPYWIFDVYYHDRQTIKGKVGNGKTRRTVSYYIEAEATFKGFTADASRQFFDDASEKLEPYDARTLQPFDVAYMSGFYADKYDVSLEEARYKALQRIGKLYDDEIMKDLVGDNLHVTSSSPQYRIERTEYVLLPVWFLTFRYGNEPYTILVNGQTGKIVGTVPMDKKKFWGVFLGLGVAFTLFFTPIFYFIHEYFQGGNHLGIIFFIFVLSLAIFLMAFGYYWGMSKNIKQTKASSMNTFVKNRQEEM